MTEIGGLREERFGGSGNGEWKERVRGRGGDNNETGSVMER